MRCLLVRGWINFYGGRMKGQLFKHISTLFLIETLGALSESNVLT